MQFVKALPPPFYHGEDEDEDEGEGEEGEGPNNSLGLE